MKFGAAFAIFAIGVGSTSVAFGQSEHAVALPGGPSANSYTNTPTGIGTTSKSANGVAPSTTPDESKTDENDDALYRGRTSEDEVTMLRDEGRLHFKTHPKEKIQQVDSLKNLQSSGSDPKFQGSLLNSDINALAKISEKINQNREGADEGDPRFKTKRLTFAPEK